MIWRLLGLLATAGFAALAIVELGEPDPALWAVTAAAAAGTGLNLVRGRPVQRWLLVILVVVPAELVIVSFMSETIPTYEIGPDSSRIITHAPRFHALAMSTVALWASLLLAVRPFHSDLDPDL